MRNLHQRLEEVKSNFYLISPEYLFGFYGIAVLLAVALVIIVYRYHKRPAKTFGSKYPFLGPIRFWLFMVAVFAFGVAALIRPAIARNGLVPVSGPVEVIFVVGTSFSEFAQDWGPSNPSRVEISRREMLKLFSTDALKSGDKVSFYIFANGSKRPMPLIDFSRHIDKFIGRTSSLLVPPKTMIEKEYFLGSSDIVLALEDVYQTLDLHEQLLSGGANWRPSFKTNRLAFVLSDGDFELDLPSAQSQQELDRAQNYLKRLDLALQEFRKRGTKIYAIGIGTRRGVELADILKKFNFNSDYNEQDQIDLAEKGLTRVNSENLKLLVSRTGGNPISDVFLIDDISKSALEFLRKSIDSHRSFKIEPVVQEGNQELWPWFLMVAILVFGLGWLVK